MGKKLFTFYKYNKLILGLLCLNFLLFLSCGSTPQNKNYSTSTISKKSETDVIVEKFMSYISENNLAEANRLMINPQHISEKRTLSQESPTKFDWARVLKERDLSLEKIIDNNTFNNDAIVKTLLIYNKDPRINLEAVFNLKNVDNHWFIYDIKFITDINKR